MLPPPDLSAHTEGMGSRFLIWSGVAVAVAATAGLAALFAVAGLGRADEVASVVGAFIGLAGLGVSVYGLVQARSDAGPGHADGDDAGRQAVSGSSVGGRTVQVSKAAGGVTVRPSPRAPVPPAAAAAGTQDAAAPTAAAPTAAAPTAAAPTGAGYGPGQSVSDSRVGGDVVQIAGADGDVEIG
jgi:hypothetical protein